MSTQSGFTRSHNALANKLISDRTSQYTEGPGTRFLPKTLIYPKLRARVAKSIPYNITVQKYSLSQYTLGERTPSYYFAEVHAALLLC